MLLQAKSSFNLTVSKSPSVVTNNKNFSNPLSKSFYDDYTRVFSQTRHNWPDSLCHAVKFYLLGLHLDSSEVHFNTLTTELCRHSFNGSDLKIL